jgi:site-specific recombinase XerD
MASYTVSLERDTTGTLLCVQIGIPLIDEYLRYLLTIGRAPTTCSSYAYDLAVFCRWLDAERAEEEIDMALRTLTAAEVVRFIEHQMRPDGEGRALAVRTVSRRITALARFFDWVIAMDLVSRNPVPRDRQRSAFGRDTSRPVFVRLPTPLPRPAPADELTAFCATLRTWRDRALVGLMVGAGLRLSEVLGLCLADLDWGGKQVFIRRGKGGRQRYAMVPDPAWTALKTYLETERPDPVDDVTDAPVFVVLHGPHRGERFTTAGVQSLFRHHRQLAQSPNVTPHRLRHTCGTELHRAGMPLEFLQEQLGHRRLESTRLYVHLSNDRLREAYLAAQQQLYRSPTPEEVR